MQPKSKYELSLFSMYRRVDGNELRFNGSFVCRFRSGESVISVGEIVKSENGESRKEMINAVFRHDNVVEKEEVKSQEELRHRFTDFNKAKGWFGQFSLMEEVLSEIW